MELIERLARNYYELYDSFEGIYSKLGKLLNKHNIGQKELYSYIGYSDNKYFSYLDTFRIRENLLRGNTEDALKIANMEDLTKLKNKLKDIDMGVPESLFVVDIKNVDYVKLLTEYLLLSQGESVNGKEVLELIKNIKQSDAKTIVNVMKSKDFKESMEALVPKFKYIENIEPCIELGVFYTDRKLLLKEQKQVISDAIKNLMLNTAIIHEKYVLNLKMKVQSNITDLYYTNRKAYLEVCDIAKFYKLSVYDLLKYCNINTVNIVEQYRKYRCIFSIRNNNLAVTVTDGDMDLTAILTKKQFKYLYENELLEFLTINKGKVVVSKGQIHELKDIL